MKLFRTFPTVASLVFTTAGLVLSSSPRAQAATSVATKAPKVTKSVPVEVSEEREEEAEALKKALAENDDKIKTTEAEIKRIKDADFLPNLYFALADLYIEKSRLLYLQKIAAHPGTPTKELDFTLEMRPKQTAVEIYQKIYAFFTSFPRRDRALFYQGRELHDLGQTEAMIKTYAQLMKEFPDSPYWLETNIALGDFMMEERKDVDGALQAYGRVLSKPQNLFTSLAHYRAGWCYVNKSEYEKAFRSFDSAIEIFDRTDRSLLPVAYSKFDIRREAVIANIVPWVELYANPKTRSLVRDGSPVAAFRERSESFMTYYRAVSRLAKRLAVKNLWQESAEAYLELLSIADDPLAQLDAASRFYEAFKVGRLKNLRFEVFQKHAALLIQELRTGSRFSAAEKTKNLRAIETMMRDVATTQHTIATQSRRAEDFEAAFQLYSDYTWALPASQFNQDMLINKAESAFNAHRFVDAGISYERAIRVMKSGKSKFAPRDYADSALQAYTQALQKPELLGATELVQARSGLRQVGTDWLKTNARKPAAANVQLNIARSWYDERDFVHAIQEADKFINAFPGSSQLMEAIGISLNSHSQLDDYAGLAKAGATYSQIKNISASDRETVKAMVRNAQMKRVQAKAGEFGTRDYAKNLKEIAKANKGTELGDQALYEAFISLKSKRDVQTFEVGEQLLKTAGDSSHAKEVSATMAQIAISTADFGRAAKYFEAYALRYPRESESASWLRSAANLYEWMGEYRQARDVFQKLGDNDSVAQMDFLARDWSSLVGSAVGVRGLQGQYLKGIALFRLKRVDEAKPILAVIGGQKGTGEEREMIAHATYLLSSDTLDKFTGIRMRDANDQSSMQTKIKVFQSLSQDLNRVISLQSGRWTIAALYGLGKANYDLGKFIQESPLPAGLSAQESSQYRAELTKQAAQYFKEAKQLFGSCLSTAEKFEVFTRFVDGCRAFGQKQVNEAEDLEFRGQASDSKPAAAAPLRLKLYDQPRDTATLLALARVYLDSRDFAMAAAIANRILEIDPRNANAQATRGVAFLYMNDLDRGFTELKKVLEIEPKNAVALWNIAGLMNEFKFKQKRELFVGKARAVGKPKLLHPFAQKI